jgi:hypothetical protein
LEQPKKPGTKDIADLKARLGLAKPAAPAAPPAPFGAPPSPAGAPAPRPAGMVGAVPSPFQAPAQAAPAADAYSPYVAMKPPAGKMFDLRPVDDGVPAESVRSKGGKAGLVIGLILLVIGTAFGVGIGGAAVGRKAFNSANAAAKTIKAELDEMQKTLTQIGVAVASSQKRMAEARQDAAGYDAQLIEDLSKVKLDPRPNTSRLFRADYNRLEDLAVDRLMTYYYDSIALYGEVERHVKRTAADKPNLEAYAAKQAEKSNANYGVVFDQRGKLAIASLVEVGSPVCKGGGSDCPADQIDGFLIRANTGANWFPRKVAPMPEGDKLVPLDRTPFLESVMNGSPDQVRMEQYKQRYNNIRLLIARLTVAQKELFEAINKAAARADLLTI